MTEVTRRSFVGAAMGTAALAPATASAFASEKETTGRTALTVPVESVSAWDKEVDLVVAGSGTGLTAAVCAVSKGCSVVVLEKNSWIGGSTLMSGGGGWFPNTRWSAEYGDTREKALAYCTAIAQEQSTPEIIEAFVDRSDEILGIVEENTEITWQAGTVFGDYHPEWEGGMQYGRSTSPIKEEGEAGAPYIYKMQAAIEAAGNEILTDTPLTALVVRFQPNGVPEVLGVEATPDGGDPIYIKAKKGVLIATGGFEWDEELKTHFLRGKTEFNVTPTSNTGDGLKMCMALGCDLRNMNECWGQSCYVKPNEDARTHGFASIGLMYDRAKPGAILVNHEGKRFINEAVDYDTFQRACFSWGSYGENGYLNLPMNIIVDQLFVDRYGLNQIDLVTGHFGPGIVDENAVSADTLEELAEKIGVPAENLVATVERFNEYARKGEDPDFHRGESYYDRVFMSDMGQEFPWAAVEATLGPIENPPFYALEGSTGTLGTCGGPRVNEFAQVIHVTGETIGRLYCTGNASSIGGPGASYPGAGGTIGPATTFAGIAGLHAAELADWE